MDSRSLNRTPSPHCYYRITTRTAILYHPSIKKSNVADNVYGIFDYLERIITFTES